MSRILVVDDNELVRRLVCDVLTEAGYVALPAESAEVALEMFDLEANALRPPPEVAIVDHHMPGMTGAEFVRELRHRGITMPAVGLTGVKDGEMELLRAGCLLVVHKPFREEPLLAAVKLALGGA